MFNLYPVAEHGGGAIGADYTISLEFIIGEYSGEAAECLGKGNIDGYSVEVNCNLRKGPSNVEIAEKDAAASIYRFILGIHFLVSANVSVQIEAGFAADSLQRLVRVIMVL